MLVAGRKAFSKQINNSYRDSDHPALGDVFGLRVAESQFSTDANGIDTRAFRGNLPSAAWAMASETGLPATRSSGLFEVLELHGAEALYRYTEGYFAGGAAAAVHHCGEGRAFYLGTGIDASAMKALVGEALRAAGIEDLLDVPHGLQAVRRGDLAIVTNHVTEERSMVWPGEWSTLSGARPEGGRLTVGPLGHAILRRTSAPSP